MADVEKFTEWRQRHALIGIADGPQFLDTAEGFAFIEQLHTYFVPTMLGTSRRMGFMIDGDEIVNTAIEQLCDQGGKIARLAAMADDPFAYLAVCLIGWIRKLWGTRSSSLDGLEGWLPAAPLLGEDSDLTPLDQVVHGTFQILAPLTPAGLHAPLLKLLGWLAANPIQRLSYEVHEKQAAHRFCPEMTIEQVTEVMLIAWGSRPRQAETSIMGALLRDPHFQVSSSGTHARALKLYATSMRAKRYGSHLLTDWT